MKCQNCGEEFSGNFCPKCGTQYQYPVQPPMVNQGQAPTSQQPIYPNQPVYTQFANQQQPTYSQPVQFQQIPNQPKKGGLKSWQIVLIVLGSVIVLAIIAGIFGSIGGEGDTSSGSSKSESGSVAAGGDNTTPVADYLSDEEIDHMYTDPKAFNGRKVTLYGKIFTSPEKDDKAVYFQMYADPDEFERNTVVGYKDPSADLKNGDYVKITGTVSGKLEGTNLFGGELTVPKIVADSVEVVDYITAVRPTVKSVEINKTIDQLGYKCTLKKVEFSDKETRLYISFENAGKESFALYKYSTKIVQNGTQYDVESNYHAEYPELQTDILQGVTTEGIITFGKMEQASFKLYLKGSSGNFTEKIEDYVFDVNIE